MRAPSRLVVPIDHRPPVPLAGLPGPRHRRRPARAHLQPDRPSAPTAGRGRRPLARSRRALARRRRRAGRLHRRARAALSGGIAQAATCSRLASFARSARCLQLLDVDRGAPSAAPLLRRL
jgi:hypothetical protein